MPTCEQINAASADPIEDCWIECEDYLKLAGKEMCPVPGCRRIRVPRHYLKNFTDDEVDEIGDGLPPGRPANENDPPQGNGGL